MDTLKIVRSLVEQGVDVTASNNNKIDAIHARAQTDHTDVITFLTERDADVTATFSSTKTDMRKQSRF